MDFELSFVSMKFIDVIIDRFKTRIFTGCDFGASYIRLVQLERFNDRFKLLAYGTAECPTSGEETGRLSIVQAYLKKHGFAGAKVAVNIEDPSLKIRSMEIAKMPEQDTKIAIRWNFRELIECPIEKYIVDYTPLPAVSGDNISIVAYGVSEDALAKHIKVVKLLGLNPASVEPNATALLSVFDYNIGWVEEEKYAIIDIGYQTVNFVVARDRTLLFSRPLAGVSIDKFIKQIQKDTSVSYENAAARLHAINQGKDDPMLASYLSQLAVEIQRSIDQIALKFQVERIDAIFLCGDGSIVPGLSAHLEKTLGVKTSILDPFNKIELGDIGRPANPQVYTVAVGLALPRA